MRQVCHRYLHPEELLPLAEQAVEEAQKKNALETEMTAVQAKIESMSSNLDKMYMDRLSGLLSEEDFQRVYLKVKRDRSVLEQRLKTLREQADAPHTTEEKAKALVTRFLETAPASRELLVSLIDRVELTQDKEIILKFRFHELDIMTEIDLKKQ